MALTQIAEPTTEPVTLAEAKEHLDVTHDLEDGKITSLLKVARIMAETFTDRAFITRSYQLRLRSFPPGRTPIIIPRPPLDTLTLVQYLDENEVLTTWDASDRIFSSPIGEFALHGNIRPLRDGFYPTEFVGVDAVQLTFDAGYGAASDVPEGIKHGIKMIMADLYNDPSSQIVGTIRVGVTRPAEAVLGSYKANRFDLRYDAD